MITPNRAGTSDLGQSGSILARRERTLDRILEPGGPRKFVPRALRCPTPANARLRNDERMLQLARAIAALKANGNQGVPQGGVISPVPGNLYLNEVKRMLERAKANARNGKFIHIAYARYADDAVILIHVYPRNSWLLKAVDERLREELAKLHMRINEEKSRTVGLARGESFGFLGFDFRRPRSLQGKWRAQYTPKLKKRTALLHHLRAAFRRYRSQSVNGVVEIINPILRGWVTHFAIGHSSRCFQFVKRCVELKVRRHMMRAGTAGALAGSGGVRSGCTRPWGCSTATGRTSICGKHSQLYRSHNLRHEGNR